MIWIQICILLLSISIGTRIKGIGLGVMGGLGLLILVFGFHLKPGTIPIDTLLIITCIVTASSALESAGGLQYLAYLSERLIRKYPNRITYVSPLVVYVFSWLSGTGHTIYPLLPIIAEVSKDIGIEPSKPLSISVIAAQQAAIAGPVSSPVAIMAMALAPYNLGLMDIVMICTPATLFGILVASFVLNRVRPKTWDISSLSKEHSSKKTYQVTKEGVWSLGLFGLGVISIFCIFILKAINKYPFLQQITASAIIEIVMLSTTALILVICKITSKSIVQSQVFILGIQAVISIMGVSWMGDTFITAHKDELLAYMSPYLTKAPWLFSLILFFMSILLLSQAATLQILTPIGIFLGLSGKTLLAAIPAATGLYIIPNYPTILAAVDFDTTGTTKLGINHSFLLPGLITTSVSLLVAHILASMLF